MPFNSDRKYWPQVSDNTIVRYLETNEIEKQAYSIIESIVALANSEGGRIFIGFKKRFSTKKEPSKGGITQELRSLYKDGIDSIIKIIPNYVEGFNDDLVTTDWIRHAYSTDYYVIIVGSYEKSLLTLNWPEKRVNSVFVRENGKNVKYMPSRLSNSSMRKRVKYKILQPIIDHSDFRNYKLINVQSPLESAYKYMTLEAFILSLHEGTWQFVEPTKWNDEYEGRFYHANYSDINKPDDCPPKLYATCITGEIANEAAWKVYSHGQGLGARCVQIKINMNKLRESLSKRIEKKIDEDNYEVVDGNVYEGLVYYDLTDNEINSIHTTSGAYYHTFFDGFDREKFLKLLLIKRKAYEYEKETRLFIIPNNYTPIDIKARKRKGDVLPVKVEWKEIIEEIRIDKKCSKGELVSIKCALEKAKVKYRDETKRGPKKASEIPLILFDVDEMEGKKNIKVYK